MTTVERPSIEDIGDARLPARFWAKVKLGPVPAHRPDLGPCWEWTAGRYGNGYSKFWWQGREHPAHRVAYQTLVGPIAPGLESDHLCRVHVCVRASHIEPVTRLVNTMRGNLPAINRALQLAKTHCPQGHPYSGENLYRRSNGGRECKDCRRVAVREYRCRQKALVA